MNRILALIDRWRARRPVVAQPVMVDGDRQIIRRFAAGETALREQAIAIHRRWILVIGVRGTPEQDFMAEADHPTPDLGLRAAYRDRLLAGA